VSDLFQDGRPDDAIAAHAAPLLDFVRRAKLSRTQVERLTAVARAFFAPTERRREAAPARTCTEPGCPRPLLARGLCASHYHATRRRRPRPPGG
jgi:hypothetical protein